MNPVKWSIGDQIQAMLQDLVLQHLDTLIPDHGSDVSQYLTVTKADILRYLSERPAMAATYFDRMSKRPKNHDIDLIDEEHGVYRVYWTDQYGVYDMKQFIGVEEAVAEHLLRTHGLPR